MSIASHCTASIAIGCPGFLGTARQSGRLPDAYTGFDPTDNLRMDRLYDPERPCRRLFPVINATLKPGRNQTHRLDRTEGGAVHRDAATRRRRLPAHARPDTGRIRTQRQLRRRRAERGARDDAGGMTLGGAITISGRRQPEHGVSYAAGNRLSDDAVQCAARRWMPNPAKSSDPAWLNRGKPNNALFALAAENVRPIRRPS